MFDETLQNLLTEAFAASGCPVCTVVGAMVFRELCKLQRDAVVDPDTHADVLARGGYCADHFWYLDALASPVTNAALLAPLLELVSERLTAASNRIAADSALLRQGAAVIGEDLGLPGACRVCERVVLWERAVLAAVLEVATQPQRRQEYTSSNGLCLPHLARALSVAPNPSIAEMLVRTGAEQAQRLAADLRTYVRKHEQRDRRWGREEAAPRAAIEKLAGGKRRAGGTES